MGTKNNPGQFDCYSAAEPDEPMFILLGRDPLASFLVGWWAGLKMSLDPKADEKGDKIKDALECAQAMDAWIVEHGDADKLKFREAVVQEAMQIAKSIERDAPNQDDALGRAVKWMRETFPQNRHAQEWADAIEKREWEAK